MNGRGPRPRCRGCAPTCGAPGGLPASPPNGLIMYRDLGRAAIGEWLTDGVVFIRPAPELGCRAAYGRDALAELARAHG